MNDSLGGQDGGTYNDKGITQVYQAAFIAYIKLEELTGGSIFSFLACQTQVNKYMKRIGLKQGVPYDKDYTKMCFYREAGEFYKERVNYVNDCLKAGTPVDPKLGYITSLEVADLIAPQILHLLGEPVNLNHTLSYNLGDIVEKRLNNEDK